MKKQILDLFTAEGTPLTAKTIAEKLSLEEKSVQAVLGDLHRDEQVTRKVDIKSKSLEYSLAVAPAPEVKADAPVKAEADAPVADVEKKEPVQATKAPKKKAPAKPKAETKAKAATKAKKPAAEKKPAAKPKKEAKPKAVKPAAKPKAQPKPKAEKPAKVAKPKGKPVKQDETKSAPPAEFINDDGTIKLDKLTKLKRGDVVEFGLRGTSENVQAVVLYPDWFFWQQRTYVRVHTGKRERWKLATKCNKLSKNDIDPAIAQKKKDILANHPPAPFTNWKKDMCLEALNAPKK